MHIGTVAGTPDGPAWEPADKPGRVPARKLVGDAMVDASPGSETDDDGTATEPPAGNLTWTTSGSADAENHDQETDLDSIGSPGGASWASVAPDSLPQYGPWHWVIYDRWIDVDDEPDPTLAEGQADTEDEAKAAVTIWVRLEVLRAALRTQDISFGELQELQNLAPYIESGDTELLEAAGVPESVIVIRKTQWGWS